MGICWSCLKGRSDAEDEEDSPLLNENTPLLREPPQTQQETVETVDRAKRDQTLNSIVNFTGENLIDVTSVSQPEVRSIGKSANEYKRILAELKFQGSQSPPVSASSPKSPKSPESVKSLSGKMLPKKASNPSLTAQDRSWLKDLGSQASKAIKDEPVIKPAGDLILTFN